MIGSYYGKQKLSKDTHECNDFDRVKQLIVMLLLFAH